MLINSLETNILFSGLSKSELDVVVSAMKRLSFAKDDIIINQGAEGDLFYVIQSGNCEIAVEGVGKVMEIGGFSNNADALRNYFGELALLYDSPRAATVKAGTENVEGWGLDRVTFKTILADSTQKQRTMYSKFLEKVEVLQQLSVYERLTIADALTPKQYSEGDVILNEGDEGFEFYIIEKGNVVCTKNLDGKQSDVSDKLGPGDYFGELSLIHNQTRAATVQACGDVKCLVLDRATFKRLLGPLETILAQNQELYDSYVAQAKEAF
jgi:cAMP-dependent protein kinase regulator